MSTPFLDSVYEQVDFDRELVFKFFMIFSLFEYALKSTGFRTGNEEYVKANWEAFAREIHEIFDPSASPELQQAVDYLENYPTKKQVLGGDNLSFTDSEVVNHRTIWLATIIKRTRNNLFHGGKFKYDRPRDTDLLNNCLIILEAWSQLHSGVEQKLRNVG